MRPLLTLGCVLLLLAPAAADGLLYRLPEDGTLIRYDFDFEASFGDDKKDTVKGTVTLGSVGQATLDKEKCRWIEVHMQLAQAGRAHGMLAKLLIPEKRLKSGEKMLDHVVKGWIREDNGEPQEWAAARRDLREPLQMFLTDPLQDVKKLPKETVASKLGKLECEGVRGITTIDIDRGRKARLSFENRLHDKSPFGVVSSKMQFVMLKNDGQVEGVVLGNFRLVEVEKNAKSELPDHK